MSAASAAEKRQPTLADRFVHAPAKLNIVRPDVLDAIRRKVRAAHRFVLDEEATGRVARVIREIPDLLVREFEFARAPFDLTWIEFPHWKLWHELQNLPDNFDRTADHLVGYLIDHNTISVFAGGTIAQPHLRPALLPIRYQLNTEWPQDAMEEFERRSGEGRRGIDEFLWGSTHDLIDPAARTLLRERNAVDWWPLGKDIDPTKLVTRMVRGGTGDLRTIVALLLMLNRPTVTRFVNRPGGRGFIRGKLLPYFSHSVVEVDFDAVRTLRLIGTEAGEGVPRRRHEVRGHYCHDRTARDMLRIAGCVHEWAVEPHEEDEPDFPCHWRCTTCGGKRWWRRAHERGDAGKGFVLRDGYEVTSAA